MAAMAAGFSFFGSPLSYFNQSGSCATTRLLQCKVRMLRQASYRTTEKHARAIKLTAK